MLDSLVGREIATRLRSRYHDIAARVTAINPPRADWQARADALDPDRWATPQAILDGVQHGDRLYEELRRELTAPGDDRTPG